VLVALTVNADGADQHNVLGHVQAVDLNDEQVELGDVAGEPFLQSLLRQHHEPARGRRLRRPVTFDAREWSLRQPDGATDETRFYITSLVMLATAVGPMIRAHWAI
jgi:hypothetical protein